MPTADQLKSLIRSHFDEDDELFHTLALQVAAHEARRGHSTLAHDIRDLIDQRSKKQSEVNIVPFPLELAGLVISTQPNAHLSRLVLADTLKSRIKKVIHEFHQRHKLQKHGLTNRRKVLLSGPPGTGKTLTSHILAGELKLPLHVIQVDKLVTRFMGETSAKLRQIFDLIRSETGVYLFDEFDAIGGDRSRDNDVGEMRRVLNALLQFIEQDSSESLIIAATNNSELLDRALFRRFDDVLRYNFPNEEERKSLITNVLGPFNQLKGWKGVLKACDSLSHAEIDHACRDAMKEAILSNKNQVTAKDLVKAFDERHKTHDRI
ncbi:MAG: ATP-binding protein [Verrucomicrobia bacterium]|nr:ATP-binding protein [Verrucomicrobiota bacterium]